MAELRLVALSQKSSDTDMLDAMRCACSHANRDYYVGECQISTINPDARLYAEIIYLINELATNGTKNGHVSSQVFLRRFKSMLQNLLPEDSIRDAKFHEERFSAIQQEEHNELKEKRHSEDEYWSYMMPLIDRDEAMYGKKKKRRQSKR